MPPDDPAAFPSSVREMAELGHLFHTHGPRLVAVVRRRLDPALAGRLGPEDVVNEAFFDARRRWAAYKADPKVSPFVWLYRIVADRLVEAWRTHTRGKRDARAHAPWPERPSADLGLQLVARGLGPVTEAVRNEQAERMKQALAGLRDADREVLMLRSYDDLSFAEIGEVLGVPENTATVRYVRALKKLKDLWHRLTGESVP